MRIPIFILLISALSFAACDKGTDTGSTGDIGSHDLAGLGDIGVDHYLGEDTSGAEDTEQPGSGEFETKDELATYATAVVLDVVEKAAAAGVVTDEPHPDILVETTPGLILYSYEEDLIIIPWWDDLGEAEQGLFNEWAGYSGAEGEVFFKEMFNWFFIPHEVDHYLALGGTYWEREVHANRVAVDYWMEQDGGPERLADLAVMLEATLAELDDPTPPGADPAEFFNENYHDLGVVPNNYGFYQFTFILAAYEARDEMTFAESVATPLAESGDGVVPATPAELIEQSEDLIDGIAEAAEAAGIDVTFVPDVLIGDNPVPAYFSEDQEIHLSWWADAPTPMQESFGDWAEWSGTYDDGHAVYVDLFYWYVVAHEAGHWLQDLAGASDMPWESERSANQIAITYFQASGHEARLANLMAIKVAVLAEMDDPTPEGQAMDEYFNENYLDLVAQPPVYIYYQFRMTVDAYEDPMAPDFAALMGQLIEQ